MGGGHVGEAPPGRGGEQQPAVVCEDLTVRYGDRVAVDGISFAARRGEVLTLLGPNGAGKTSTVETLEGYRRPSGGRVRVLERDPVSEHRLMIPKVGVMLQRGGVYPMLSPRRALNLFASYYEDPEPTEALLELVDLVHVARTPWRHLSGGEQQRLALALALIGHPDVAFLDEPTSGVDPHGRVAIRQVITTLAQGGACVLLTTHELDEAERLSDRVLILRHGRVVAEGAPGQLAAALGSEQLRFGAPAHLDLAGLSRALGAPAVEEGPGQYRVDVEPSPKVTAALTAWLAERDVGLTQLRTGRSLEDVYLSLVGPDDADGSPSSSGEER